MHASLYRNDTIIAVNPPSGLLVSPAPASGGSVTLAWDPVTTDVLGNPVQPNHYLILGSSDPYDEDSFSVLAATTQMTFTDPDPGSARFYKVIAVFSD